MPALRAAPAGRQHSARHAQQPSEDERILQAAQRPLSTRSGAAAQACGAKSHAITRLSQHPSNYANYGCGGGDAWAHEQMDFHHTCPPDTGNRVFILTLWHWRRR